MTGGPTEPQSWELAELFKIEKNIIRRIGAIMTRPPYGMKLRMEQLERWIVQCGAGCDKIRRQVVLVH